jgi:hypothetical protein
MLVTIGRKIYYNKLTGQIIFDTGERTGTNIRDTTIEEDYQYVFELQNQNREITGVLQLKAGEFIEEFNDCIGYRVNPETIQLEFTFREDGSIEEPIFEKPYKEQIQALTGIVETLQQSQQAYVSRIVYLEQTSVQLQNSINDIKEK